MARVLVVDDSLAVRQLISMALKARHHEVTEAADGRLALDSMSGGTFDLVILDINMPVLNGLETLSEMRSLGIDTPVIVVTTERERASVERAVALGATDYVPKPFKPTELVRRVDALLDIFS